MHTLNQNLIIKVELHYAVNYLHNNIVNEDNDFGKQLLYVKIMSTMNHTIP